jgi:FkbH-like protein
MEIARKGSMAIGAKGEVTPAADARRVDPRLERLAWQPVLFAEQPRRWDLIKLQTGHCSCTLRLRVHRNHGFEGTARVMAPYLALRNWQAEFTYSDYDDSLNFQVSGPAEAEIVWLDYSHYIARNSSGEFAAWLRQRMLALRQLTDSPIILVNWPEPGEYAKAVQEVIGNHALPGLFVGSLEAIRAVLGGRVLDKRMLQVSGSRLSAGAMTLIARELACHWIPAAIAPRLKAVALDLDSTLFAGVLGEDGPEGVELTPGHRALQQYLLELRASGLFLALVSRNVESDVRRLLELREDFPMRWEHFSVRRIHWASKPESLEAVAHALRIGMDAVLYLDDNLGELASVADAHPDLCLAHAHADAFLTRRVLEYFPGIWSNSKGGADALRVKDLDTNRERNEILRQASSRADYLRSLQVALTFELNPRVALGRLHELSRKTNQFNVALKRFSEVEIERRLQSPDCKVVTIRLADRLSDSGIIGALFAREEAEAIVVEELCISCRALGRELEDIMVAKALETACPQWPEKALVFEQAAGPRNDPARQWLRRAAGDAWDPAASRVAVPVSFMNLGAEYSFLDVKVDRTSG